MDTSASTPVPWRCALRVPPAWSLLWWGVVGTSRGSHQALRARPCFGVSTRPVCRTRHARTDLTPRTELGVPPPGEAQLCGDRVDACRLNLAQPLPVADVT